MGETSQTASGTPSVFAYLRLRHAKGRDAIFGQLRKERRDREACEAGSRAGREASQLEELHRRGQTYLVAKSLGRELQRDEHVIRYVKRDLSHDSLGMPS